MKSLQKSKLIPSWLTLTAVCLALLSGCGGSTGSNTGGGTGGTGGASVTVSGTATKGPVANATVTLYDPASGGTFATVTTDANGNWTANIPSGTGPVWVSVNGGSYTDEATGQTITVPARTTGIEILAALFDPAQQTTVPVTPITTALAKAAEWSAIDRSGALTSASLSTALREAVTQYTAAFGFDPTATMPTSNLANATAAQKMYAAVLGGISQLADTLRTNGITIDSTITTTDAVDALVYDFAADGKFDGKSYGGIARRFGSANTALVSSALPATVGVTALSNAITQYLAGPRAPTQLAGITVNLQAPNVTGLFPGGFAGGGGGGGGGTPGAPGTWALNISGTMSITGAGSVPVNTTVQTGSTVAPDVTAVQTAFSQAYGTGTITVTPGTNTATQKSFTVTATTSTITGTVTYNLTYTYTLN